MQISSDRKTLPSQDPGDVDLPIDQLVSGLALRYRLIDQKQAALIADRQFGQIACACQKMREEGLLTKKAEFQFLRARAHEVAEAGGCGPTGTTHVTELFELASSLGYLSEERISDFLEEHSLELQLRGGQPAGPAVYLPLLFNLGYLELYQTIDLLEKLGVLLDHCDRCRIQRFADGVAATYCPSCNLRMRRLTGWQAPEEMMTSIPPLRIILVRRPTVAPEQIEAGAELAVAEEGLETADVTVAGHAAVEQSPDVGRAVVQAEVAEASLDSSPTYISDQKLVTLIKRYRMLDDAQLKQLARAYGGTERSLFQVLAESGLLPSYAVCFLARGGPEPADGQSLLALAIERHYLSPGVKPHGKDSLAIEDELVLLARTYNNQNLDFYQLIDLLVSAGIRIEHCETCQIQVHVPPQCALVRCPCCRGGITPLNRPGEPLELLDRLPPIAKLVMHAIESANNGSSTATREAGNRRDCRRVESRKRPPPPKQHDPDDLMQKLILRYGMMTAYQLKKAVGYLEASSAVLEQRLFEDGCLTAMELSFLKQKREQANGRLLGELSSKSLTEIALLKGYINQRRLLKISRLPGSPDFGCSADSDIASFLFARGALSIYQVIDLFEEIGVYLLDCGDCGVQYHLVGQVDPNEYHVCHSCNGVLVALTTPPNWPLWLHPLPEIEALVIRQVEADEMDTLAASATSVRMRGSRDQDSSRKAQTVSLSGAGDLEAEGLEAIPVEMEESGLYQVLERPLQARQQAKAG